MTQQEVFVLRLEPRAGNSSCSGFSFGFRQRTIHSMFKTAQVVSGNAQKAAENDLFTNAASTSAGFAAGFCQKSQQKEVFDAFLTGLRN